jgi:hypothetical protein
MFAWYVPIAAGERFILPLLGPALVSAAAMVSSLAAGGVRPFKRGRVAMVVVWSVVWVLACWLSTGFVDRNG